MTTYGYARVSTDGQTLDAQQSALKAAGAEKVFSEKQSGAKTDRAALGRVLAALESIKFGRKPKLSKHQISEAKARREAGEAMTEIGRSYNVSHSTMA
jgi:Resolvase, N terminal domain/Helix-turn-helix domain of resolvase